MNEQITKPEEFNRFGCVLVKNFLDPITTKTISMYFENKIRRQEWEEKTTDPTSKFSYYADPLIEAILLFSLPLVEESCGKELQPTYSYSRIYQSGEKLTPHIDRPACEISVTVNVASVGAPSAIWMHYGDNAPISYELEPGDAVVYKGCETRHWRSTLLQEQLNVQFMLHYVDKNGPFVNHMFDKRSNLGFPSTSKERSM